MLSRLQPRSNQKALSKLKIKWDEDLRLPESHFIFSIHSFNTAISSPHQSLCPTLKSALPPDQEVTDQFNSTKFNKERKHFVHDPYTRPLLLLYWAKCNIQSGLYAYQSIKLSRSETASTTSTQLEYCFSVKSECGRVALRGKPDPLDYIQKVRKEIRKLATSEARTRTRLASIYV